MTLYRPHEITSLFIKLLLTIWNPAAYYQSTIPPKTDKRTGTESDIVRHDLRETIIMSMARCYPVIQGLYAAFSGVEVLRIFLHCYRGKGNDSFIASGPNTSYLSSTFLIGSALISIGWFIRQQCYKTMRENFTFHITDLKKHKLITSGPYSIVRHPSYIGMAMVAIGSVLTLHSPGLWFHDREASIIAALIRFWSVWFATLSFLLQFRMPAEDELLRRKFGKEWESYAKRVPYWLIPGVL